LLLAATVLHVTFTLAIFVVGRLGILPNTFDEHGIGTSFAIDSKSYRIEAEVLADTLRNVKLSDWASHPRIHVKVYSLSFVALDPFLGSNILSAEPVNLTYFLLILILVYAIGKEMFDDRVGLLAAVTVALWPSFLLHTTQMLRDPLFIAALLLLMLTFVILLTRSLSWRQGTVAGVVGSITCLFLWLIRGDWWELIFAVLLIGMAMPFMQQVWQRKFQAYNALGGVLIVFAGVFLPQFVPAYRQPDYSMAATSERSNPLLPANQVQTRPEGRLHFLSRVPRRISLLRHRFIVRYPEAGSNIDTDVELTGWTGLVRYFPRAVVIGLLSPFPTMWLSRGAQVGLAGRLLAGAEMIVLYIIVALALLCAFSQRRCWAVWLLLATVLVGVTGLGFVVINMSTIYRMRYGFVMLLIVLGAQGLSELQSLRFRTVMSHSH
jgi:hypothetical protein